MNQHHRSMDNQNINQQRVETAATPMTRFSIDDCSDDDSCPIVIKRPRFSEPASQSRIVTEEEEEEEESDSEGSECDEDDEMADDDGFEADDYSDGETAEAVNVPVPEVQNRTPPVVMTTATSSTEGLKLPYQQIPIPRRMDTDSNAFNNAKEELQVVLTDPDVLDCPICYDPLCSPVFQCENGHIACNSCCSKIKRKCPSCYLPIGYNRCRAIEKVIESVKISCKNAPYGCYKTMNYSKKDEHEQTCPYVKCFCPHPSCPFASSSENLYFHFGKQHADSITRFTYNTTFTLSIQRTSKHMFLQEQNESVIFILNHEVKEHGRSFSVDCVGPSSLKTSFVCHLTAKKMEAILSLQCVPEMYTKWSDNTPKKYILTVPSNFSLSNGVLSLGVRIKKAESSV
ncbi:E3 ubiquitin-protein ligase SINA-like 7 [Rutidosis leptorrhynchoides]|uniref:E3 ubiquitin-protein ligase SINA-like 7 n=1 Tax=Rutidosis leptorrhynchoides TaxID=125765 RepID=UPI003A999E0C